MNIKIYIDADGCPVVDNILKIAANLIYNVLLSAILLIR